MSNNSSHNKNKKLQPLICSICQFPGSKPSHHGQFQAFKAEHSVGKRCTRPALRGKLFLSHISWRSWATIWLASATALTPLHAESYDKGCSYEAIFHMFSKMPGHNSFLCKTTWVGKLVVSRTALAALKGKLQPRVGRNFCKGIQQSGLSVGKLELRFSYSQFSALCATICLSPGIDTSSP